MNQQPQVCSLKGTLRHYDWGGYRFIPELLGTPNDRRLPHAEYWLGAHELSPSTVSLEPSGALPLNTMIRAHPEACLGKAVQATFGRLPFLLKVLDVREMLSIQVHPSRSAAQAGFARENSLGLAPDSPARNYADDNHKPELVVALGELWMLHGFLDPRAIWSDERKSSLAPLRERVLQHGYERVCHEWFAMPDDEVKRLLEPVLERSAGLYASGRLTQDDPDYWAARWCQSHAGASLDRGLLFIYLLNLVHLRKGEAVFQAPGVLHAYLEGQGIEIMASSDNVLRAGLTRKRVDPTELLKQASFTPLSPVLTRQRVNDDANSQRIEYDAPVNDFHLAQIVLRKHGRFSGRSFSLEIFLVLAGRVEVASRDATLRAARGEALVVFADTDYEICSHDEPATLFRASVSRG